MANSDAIAEAVRFGRADGYAGRPMDPQFVDGPDDCSAEANAYRRSYRASERLASARGAVHPAAAE